MTSRRLLLLSLASLLSFGAYSGSARAEDDSALGADPNPAPKPAKKKADAKKKKKTYDYDKSKYKSNELSQTINYKFNEKGDPIKASEKKKAAAKKKRSEPPEAEAKEGGESCGGEDSCAEKKTEADAL